MPLRLKTSSIDVEVKIQKIGNRLLTPEPEIVSKTVDGTPVEKVRVVSDNRYMWHGKNVVADTKYIDPETGKHVPSSEVLEILDHYKSYLLDAEGNTVEKDDVYDYVLQEDGTENPVKPFDRTKLLHIPDENWISVINMSSFLVTNMYEVFGKDKKVQRKLFEEAEKRLEMDTMGLTNWSFGGYKQYYAFLEPVVTEGKFVWLLKLSNTQVEYRHMQEIPVKLKVPIIERPTLKTLPPVKALLVTAK